MRARGNLRLSGSRSGRPPRPRPAPPPGNASEPVPGRPALCDSAGPPPASITADPVAELTAVRGLAGVRAAELPEGTYLAIGARLRAGQEVVVPPGTLAELRLSGGTLLGYELAARLRERPESKDCAMIALTGYGQESDQARSRAAGFAAHLVKPIDPTRLLTLIEAMPPAPARPRP